MRPVDVGQPQIKGGSGFAVAFHPNVAEVCFGYLFGDGEANTGAGSAVAGVRRAVEALEDAFALFRNDVRAVVMNAEDGLGVGNCGAKPDGRNSRPKPCACSVPTT